MKTLALMITSGGIYAAASELICQALYNHGLDGDSLFAMFIIGVVAGVFSARSFGWID